MDDPNKVWPTGLTVGESEELHRNIIQGTQIFGMIAALAQSQLPDFSFRSDLLRSKSIARFIG